MANNKDTHENNSMTELIGLSDEQSLFYFMNSIQDGIAFLDRDLNIVRVNNWIKENIPHHKEIIGEKCHKLFHKNDVPCENCPVIKCFETQKHFSIETHFDTTESHSKHFEIKAFPLINSHGENKYVIEHIRDISSLKKVQNNLKESKEKFKALYEKTPFSYQSLDIEGKVLDINPQWLNIMGYSREEVVGRWFGDFLHPSSRENFHAQFKQFIETGTLSDLHLQLQLKNNSYIHVLFEGCIGYDEHGNFKQTYCTFKDISAQEKNNKLQENQYRISTLQNTEENPTVFFEKVSDSIVHAFDARYFGIKIFSSYTSDSIQSYHSEKDHALAPFFKDLIAQVKENNIQIAIPLADEPFRGHSVFGIPVKDTAKHKTIGVAYALLEKPYLTEEESKYFEVIVNHISQFYSRTLYLEKLKNAISLAEEGKQRYQSLFKNSTSPMLIIDPIYTKIIDANNAASNFYGYTQEELKKMFFRDLGSLPNNIFQKKQNPAKGSEEKHWIVKQKLASGITKEVEIYVSEVYSNHKPYYYIIIHDISKQVKAQEESARLYKAINQSPEPIALTDTAGNFKYVNPAYSKLSNYSYKELLGKNANIFRSGKHTQEFYANLWATIQNGITWEGEIINKKKDNTLFIEEAKITPILNDIGVITHYIKVARDITKQRKIENELKESRNQLHAILNNMPGGYIMIDDQYRIRQVNKETCKITGYSQQELVGSFCDIVCPKGSVSNHCPIFAEGKISFSGMDTFIKHKNQTLVPIIKNAHRITLGGENFLIENFQNISNLKETEKKLIKSKERAEESDRLKSAFLSNMSHEIRTPMNGILGFTEMLAEPEFNDYDQDHLIKNIQKSGQRMLNTVNDIIEISKIEVGEVTIRKKWFNINEKIKEIIQFFKPEAEQKNLTLFTSFTLANAEAMLYSDETKFESLVTNLVKNAIKYSDKGKIEFGYIAKDELIEFYCSDEGIGIPEERLEAVFNRFEQADITDQRAFQGSGLGLAISKAYVEILGGKIWVSSIEHKGSVFYFTLPLEEHRKNIQQQEQPTTTEQATPIRSSSKEKHTILIVEDDETSVLYLTIILDAVAHKIHIAKNGKEALEKIKSHPEIEVILLDIQLPLMNGYEVAKEIRKFNTQVKIIAQTAFAFQEDFEKALTAGCNDYVSKPINKSQLIDKIHRLTS